MLKFDPVEHKYTVDDRELISVTTLLKSVGIINDRFYKPSGPNRGILVHELTEQIDLGTIDWFGVTDEIMPYLEAWLAFKKDYEPIFTGIEKKMYHPLYGYAGTLDRMTDGWIYDIKSGKPEKWHELQLTFYHMMAYHKDKEMRRLAGVYLTNKGTYKVEEYVWDDSTCLSIIGVNNWKNK